jgi:hypothetical protein
MINKLEKIPRIKTGSEVSLNTKIRKIGKEMAAIIELSDI